MLRSLYVFNFVHILLSERVYLIEDLSEGLMIHEYYFQSMQWRQVSKQNQFMVKLHFANLSLALERTVDCLCKIALNLQKEVKSLSAAKIALSECAKDKNVSVIRLNRSRLHSTSYNELSRCSLVELHVFLTQLILLAPAFYIAHCISVSWVINEIFSIIEVSNLYIRTSYNKRNYGFIVQTWCPLLTKICLFGVLNQRGFRLCVLPWW